MKTLPSPKEQLENSYNQPDRGVTIKRVRLRRLTVKDDTLLDVLYEESDDNGHTWFDGSKKVETFGIESVFDEVKTLTSSEREIPPSGTDWRDDSEPRI